MIAGREREPAGVLLRALVVGLLGGSAGLVLRLAATEAPRLVWPGPDMVQGVALAPPAARALVPAVGGLLAGLVLALGSRWAGGARGWDILEAVVLRDGVLPLRSALVRAASSLVTQASAGAVGREGPIVLVAAATASGVGRRLGVPTRERRVLVACGIAAGLPARTTRPSEPPCSRWRSSWAASPSRRSPPSPSPRRRPRSSPGPPSAATRSSTCPRPHSHHPGRSSSTSRSACSAAWLRPSSCSRSARAPPSTRARGCRGPWPWPRPASRSASSRCATRRSWATAGRRSPRSSPARGASSTSWRCSRCGSS